MKFISNLPAFKYLALGGVLVASACSACASPIGSTLISSSTNGTFTAPAGDIVLSPDGSFGSVLDTLQGSLTFTNGVVTAVNFTYFDATDGTSGTSFDFTASNSSGVGFYTSGNPTEYEDYLSVSTNGGGQLYLAFSEYLDPSGDIVLCGTSTSNPGYCDASGGQSYPHVYNPNAEDFVDSGTLSSSVSGAAPEPSSLILLGTGLLGAAGLARRRLFAA